MSSIASAYKLQIEKLSYQVNSLILENRKLKRILNEGPIWGEGEWRDLIADPNTAYASTDAQTASPNSYNSTVSNRTSPAVSGFLPTNNRGNRGNQGSGGITPEQYTAHAYQIIMGIMQDAVDGGIISQDMMSQLAGQAYATWVAGGPSALENFLNQNNIPFLSESYIRLNEGPIWDGGEWRDLIGDPNTAYASTDAQTASPNSYTSTVSNRTSPAVSGFAPSSRGNRGSGGITPEQYTAHAYQVIMGIMQDAVDSGAIDPSSMSQLAGQAYATWVAGGPSALENFLNQNNIPFQK